MTVARNLSRARSHIIFIVALLSAASYILWVEDMRGRPSEAASVETQWRVELGPFDSAAAAGGSWDRLRGQVPELRGADATIVESADGVRLRAGPLPGQRDAVRICDTTRANGARCDLVSPAL
jgi:hypothetical protein